LGGKEGRPAYRSQERKARAHEGQCYNFWSGGVGGEQQPRGKMKIGSTQARSDKLSKEREDETEKGRKRGFLNQKERDPTRLQKKYMARRRGGTIPKKNGTLLADWGRRGFLHPKGKR